MHVYRVKEKTTNTGFRLGSRQFQAYSEDLAKLMYRSSAVADQCRVRFKHLHGVSTESYSAQHRGEAAEVKLTLSVNVYPGRQYFSATVDEALASIPA